MDNIQETAEQMAAKVLSDDTLMEGGIVLPSQLQVNQVGKLQFRATDDHILCIIRGVHFYNGKVKYDLGLWLGDGTVDNHEETRIYNIDSVFVSRT